MSFNYSFALQAGLTLALLATGLGGASSASAQSILGNSGFETGSPDPWTAFYPGGGQTNAVQWHITSDDVHSGKYAATCTGDEGLTQSFAPVAATDIAQFSFWAKGSGFIVLSNSEDGHSIDGSFNSGVSSDYKFFDFTDFVQPDEENDSYGTYDNFTLYSASYPLGNDNPTSTFVDDFTFQVKPGIAPVPEASTTVSLGLLLTLGGIAVALKRRKAISL